MSLFFFNTNGFSMKKKKLPQKIVRQKKGKQKPSRKGIDAFVKKLAESASLEVADKFFKKYGHNYVNAKDSVGNPILSLSIYYGHEPLALYLIDKGADIQATDENGNTPLIYAASGHNDRLTRHLVNQGADVNARNINGITALDMAIHGGLADIVSFLISQGADVGTKDNFGKKALDKAREKLKIYSNIVKMIERKSRRW